MSSKSLLSILVVGAVLVCAAARAEENQAPVVTNVTAEQQGDCGDIVNIYYDLADADGDVCCVWVKISEDGGTTWTVPVARASGDVGPDVTEGTGKHIVWDVSKDAPGLKGSDFVARVCADDKHYLADMCYVADGLFQPSTGLPWVYLDAYWIDTYEVTNELYCRFLNSGGNDDHWHSEMEEIVQAGEDPNYSYTLVPGYEQRPVQWMTWFDAVAFCDWRSEEEGLPAGSYYLPTEAQWEKAAAWDPDQKKFWTYGFQSDTIDCNKCNYNYCVGHTTDVGSYPYTSYYGCYDMSGNLYEWCADWYVSAGYPSSSYNPTGPSSGTSRVLRGGYYNKSATYAEAGSRILNTPSYVDAAYGFRCARTLE